MNSVLRNEIVSSPVRLSLNNVPLKPVRLSGAWLTTVYLCANSTAAPDVNILLWRLPLSSADCNELEVLALLRDASAASWRCMFEISSAIVGVIKA